MNTRTFKVSFLRRAAIELAHNEKVAIWEPTRAGSLYLDDAGIHLDGKWRVSAIGNFLGGGLLGELIIKPLFLKDRSETIPFESIDKLVIHTRKKRRERITFHILQPREQGMVEVHVFTSHKDTTSSLADAIKHTVPSHLVKEETLS